MQAVRKLFLILLATLSVTVIARPQNKSESQKIREQLSPQNVGKSSDQIALENLTALLTPVGVKVSKDNLINNPKDEFHYQTRLRWEAYESAPQFVRPGDPSFRASHKLAVLEKKKLAGGVPQPNAVIKSSELIFVAAVNQSEELIWWTTIYDPRVARFESADSEGKLSGQLLHASNPTFFVEYPSDPRIKELRFYEFINAGTTPTLSLINTVPMN